MILPFDERLIFLLLMFWSVVVHQLPLHFHRRNQAVQNLTIRLQAVRVHVLWPCFVVVFRGHDLCHDSWSCFVAMFCDMFRGHYLCHVSCHVLWSCFVGMFRGHVSWSCFVVMFRGHDLCHVSWPWFVPCFVVMICAMFRGHDFVCCIGKLESVLTCNWTVILWLTQKHTDWVTVSVICCGRKSGASNCRGLEHVNGMSRLKVSQGPVFHSFHWHVQNATIPCRSQELLTFLFVIYFFLPPFSTHFILPSISKSTSRSLNTLLGILLLYSKTKFHV
jgi:hypothetical protein